jgi:DTW domain-containing protein
MELLKPQERMRCYGCHRPKERCFCDRIPTIANRTHVLIVQHARERFHPFNTARILRKALVNSQLMVDQTKRLAEGLASMTFSTNVGLLYPGPDAILLDELTEADRPQQLVVLDGTWHHTKTLFRDIPALQRLPRFRLAPTEPSRYKIRREPNSQYLSTLEATVAALQSLEPETESLERIVAAFEGMIDDQISLPMSGYGWRRNHRRRPLAMNIPRAIQNHLEKIVVVYGETAPGTKGDRTKHCDHASDHIPQQTPVYWVAQRMVSGDRFECAIAPPCPLSSNFLGHLQLPETAFHQALSFDEFRSAWNRFLRPDDVLTFYYSNVAKLLKLVGGRANQHVHLKSIQMGGNRESRTLEQLLIDWGVSVSSIHCHGRAGIRLANSIAFLETVLKVVQEI